jgi:hypothetical protein
VKPRGAEPPTQMESRKEEGNLNGISNCLNAWEPLSQRTVLSDVCGLELFRILEPFLQPDSDIVPSHECYTSFVMSADHAVA